MSFLGGLFGGNAPKAPPPPILNTNYQPAPTNFGRVPTAPGRGDTPQFPGAYNLGDFRGAPNPISQIDPSGGGSTGRMGLTIANPNTGTYARDLGLKTPSTNWGPYANDLSLYDPNPNVTGAGQGFARSVASGGLLNGLPGSDPDALVRAQTEANRTAFLTNAGMGRENIYGSTEAVRDADGNITGQRQTLSEPAAAMAGSAGAAGKRIFSDLPGTKLDFDNSTLTDFASQGYNTQMGLLKPQFDQQKEALKIELTNRGISPGDAIWDKETGNLDRQQGLVAQSAASDAMKFAPTYQGAVTNTQITQHMQPYGEANAAFGLYAGMGGLTPGFTNMPQLGATDVAGISLGAGNQQIAGTGQALNAGQIDFGQNQGNFSNALAVNAGRLGQNAQNFSQQGQTFGAESANNAFRLGINNSDNALDQTRFGNVGANNNQILTGNAQDWAQRTGVYGMGVTGANMANQNLQTQFGQGQTATQNEFNRIAALYGLQNNEYSLNRANITDPWNMNMQAQQAGNAALTGQYGMQMQQAQFNEQQRQANNAMWGDLFKTGAGLALMPMTGGLYGGFNNTMLGGAMRSTGLYGGGGGAYPYVPTGFPVGGVAAAPPGTYNPNLPIG